MIKSKRGFIERINVANNMARIFKGVLAEEPQEAENSTKDNNATNGTQTPNPQQPASNNLNYEDLISRARKEEKDKLYPQIEALKKSNEALIEKNNVLIIKNAELSDQVAQLKSSSNATESDKVKELQKEIKALQKENKEYKDNIVDVASIKEQVRKDCEAKFEVDLYKAQRLGDLKGQIIPELVQGATKEDIDTSIEASKKRFDELRQGILGSVNVPPANPSNNSFGNSGMSLNDLANLDPRSSEYAKVRAQLGLR